MLKKLKKVWNSIQSEAVILVDREVILSNFFYDRILKHKNLSNALSYILSNKLKNTMMPANSMRNVIKDIYLNNKNIILSAVSDILAVHSRDPVIKQYSYSFIIPKKISCSSSISY